MCTSICMFVLLSLQVTEEARVKAYAQERSLDAKVIVLQDKLKKLNIEDFTSDAVLIRKHQEQTENNLHSVQHQVLELLKSTVPNAVQQYVQMNSAVVITGDYQLKLARQEYFFNKQNIVIEHLLKQRARQEFLQMVMEVEAQAHRDLYSLLQKLQKALQEEWRDFQERMCKMMTIQQQDQERSAHTIDSTDTAGKALLNILEGSGSGCGTLFPTYTRLAEAAEKLEEQNRALQENILTNRMEQMQCLDSLEGELKKWLNLTYGNTTVGSSQPITGPRELAEGLTKLASKVETLEKRVLDGMRDFDRRKKQLQANPLHIKERELFVSFFLSPKHLKTEVETLLAQAEGELLLKQK
ncbi:HAUS augmin-like complex subunit 3 [Limulus polyphemus]|uniref:HAUS augmin-like complex subunit 3 n=1 Tax=Limulus polyphemus TaxID=6850 RepID=A0ABM1SID6_LIMPO|nr:HAUS augmin-like complex subunit 3 [Limulus polyphemus]